eukprot:15364409-Ditylum_brightwellii.AAC.1
MSKLSPRPDFDSVLDTLGPSPSVPPHKSNASDLSYVDAATTASLYSTQLFKEEGRGTTYALSFASHKLGTETLGQSVSTTTPLDLSQNHEDYDIVHFPSTCWLCIRFIVTAKTKFCTWITCNIDNYWCYKWEDFCAGLYLWAGQNAV